MGAERACWSDMVECEWCCAVMGGDSTHERAAGATGRSPFSRTSDFRRSARSGSLEMDTNIL